MYQRKRGRQWRTIRTGMGLDISPVVIEPTPSNSSGDSNNLGTPQGLPTSTPSGGGWTGALPGAPAGGGGSSGPSAFDKILGAVFGGSSTPNPYPGYPPGTYPPGMYPQPQNNTTLYLLLAGGGLLAYSLMKD